MTPASWLCLDGTLHLDATDRWLVFCHEWLQCGDGEVCALQLSHDLRRATGEPRLLFRASEAAWTRPAKAMTELATAPPPHYVTDGPFLHRTPDGELVMLWSSFGEDGYAMGLARSTSGALEGPWRQDDQPIWSEDGGHGMVFRTFDGQLHLTLHRPNQTPFERAVFVPLDEQLARRTDRPLVT